MGRISRQDRERQLAAEEAGQHLYANRVRVYPKAVHGMVRRFKWAILIFCLTVYYLLPWLRWDRGPGMPDQAVLLSIAQERFYFFNLEFWPQDIYYLTGLLIMGAVGLFLVTSLAGRVWCGYTCPQTVWTDLFMLVERWIEGDRNERMRRDAGALTFDKTWRKIAKHGVWLFIAFWTGGAWIMYFVDAPTVTVEFWSGTASTAVYLFTGIFTSTTYLLAGWAREQVCTYMCPWPRFQSAMLDEQSFIVTYQGWRGEPRGKLKQGDTDLGDCIDCGSCVTACPTGIDIRDGVQLECINCGLCIDACNHVMERIERPRWLITWDTLAGQAAKARGVHEEFRLLRPRTIIYICALVIAVSVMGVALATRPAANISVLRDRAPLFVRVSDGSLRNGYTVKIANKTRETADFELSLRGLPGAAMSVSEEGAAPVGSLALPVPADQIGTWRVLIRARPHELKDGSQPVEFVAHNTRTGETVTYHSVFMGPVGYVPGAP